MAEILPPLRENPTTDMTRSDRIDSLKNMAMAVYILNLLAFFNGLTAVLGAVIAYVKRADAAGTIYESHFRDQIRIFWIALGVSIVGGILLFVLIGWPILLVLGLWFLYRNVKGLMQLANKRAAD